MEAHDRKHTPELKSRTTHMPELKSGRRWIAHDLFFGAEERQSAKQHLS
jgi:hypothetical protein